MKFTIKAACGCNTGIIRSNNEDNFLFNGHYLDADNEGLNSPLSFLGKPKQIQFAVFDGMGGENYGEIASFTAAQTLSEEMCTPQALLRSNEKYLQKLIQRLNRRVVDAKVEMCTMRMGTTVVGLYFTSRYAYVYNVGDSRAYRLRDGELLQLSKDHVSTCTVKLGQKASLTQHLGIDPEHMLIEPHIARYELKPGDKFLLCSDGLTDMLDNFEITENLLNSSSDEMCVYQLIQTALEYGGRDNITAIVCSIV